MDCSIRSAGMMACRFFIALNREYDAFASVCVIARASLPV
jgi:hypothetical protein